MLPQFKGVNRMRRFFTFNQETWAKNMLKLARTLDKCGVEDWNLERERLRAIRILQGPGENEFGCKGK